MLIEIKYTESSLYHWVRVLACLASTGSLLVCVCLLVPGINIITGDMEVPIREPQKRLALAIV